VEEVSHWGKGKTLQKEDLGTRKKGLGSLRGDAADWFYAKGAKAAKNAKDGRVEGETGGGSDRVT